MARQTTITLVDDLDGSEAEEQVEFSVDGRTYEIDLSAVNASADCATRSPRSFPRPAARARRRADRRRAPSRPSSDRAQNQAIREWAIAQGMKVSERGRIPTNVLTAYHSAH